MSINFTRKLAAVCAIVLSCVARATAQDAGPYTPFNLEHDVQLFAPTDFSSYGNGPKPNEGFFFAYDMTEIWLDPPDVSAIGVRSLAQVDTSPFTTDSDTGHRLEGGWINDNKGWSASGFHNSGINQQFFADGSRIILFDPRIYNVNPAAPVINPIEADVRIRNELSIWGAEINRVWRFDRSQRVFAPTVEASLGVRTMRINDKFLASIEPGPDDTYLRTDAENYMLGPQAGVRMSKRYGFWGWSVEGKFFSAFNFQTVDHQSKTSQAVYDAAFANIFQNGVPDFPTAHHEVDHETEWTPVTELRMELKYLITNKITIRGGWTGMLIGSGLVRAAEKTDFSNEAPVGRATSGLFEGENTDNMFGHMVTLGLEINR